MQKAAIYVRGPLPASGSVISNENQEIACREYCLSRDLTVSATFRGHRPAAGKSSPG